MNLEYLGHVACRPAFVDEALTECDLFRGELGGPAEADASLHGRDASAAGALLDQRPLELGDAGEHGQHHAPSGRCGVGPGLAQRAQPGVSIAQLFGNPAGPVSNGPGDQVA